MSSEAKAQALPGQLMSIGVVAASNLVKQLGLAVTAIPIVEQAMKDEISAMSSHFTLAVTDLQDQFTLELQRIRSTHKYVRENRWVLGGWAVSLIAVGFFLGQVA